MQRISGPTPARCGCCSRLRVCLWLVPAVTASVPVQSSPGPSGGGAGGVWPGRWRHCGACWPPPDVLCRRPFVTCPVWPLWTLVCPLCLLWWLCLSVGGVEWHGPSRLAVCAVVLRERSRRFQEWEWRLATPRHRSRPRLSDSPAPNSPSEYHGTGLQPQWSEHDKNQWDGQGDQGLQDVRASWGISANVFVRWATQHQRNKLTWNIRHRNTHMCNIVILWNFRLQRWQPRFCSGTVKRFWRGRPWTCWSSPCTRTAHRLDSAIGTSVGFSVNHATRKVSQRVEVGRAR